MSETKNQECACRAALEQVLDVVNNVSVCNQFVYDKRGKCLGTVFELSPSWREALATPCQPCPTCAKCGNSGLDDAMDTYCSCIEGVRRAMTDARSDASFWRKQSDKHANERDSLRSELERTKQALEAAQRDTVRLTAMVDHSWKVVYMPSHKDGPFHVWEPGDPSVRRVHIATGDTPREAIDAAMQSQEQK